jgi:hypothetical protein
MGPGPDLSPDFTFGECSGQHVVAETHTEPPQISRARAGLDFKPNEDDQQDTTVTASGGSLTATPGPDRSRVCQCSASAS